MGWSTMSPTIEQTERIAADGERRHMMMLEIPAGALQRTHPLSEARVQLRGRAYWDGFLFGKGAVLAVSFRHLDWIDGPSVARVVVPPKTWIDFDAIAEVPVEDCPLMQACQLPIELELAWAHGEDRPLHLEWEAQVVARATATVPLHSPRDALLSLHLVDPPT
jgi:hypothetical protein